MDEDFIRINMSLSGHNGAGKTKKKISIEIITTQLSKRYKIFINKIKSRHG
jgi:hypothetical protein